MRFAERRGEGTGVMLAYRENSHIAAWPFLLRPIGAVLGLEKAGKGLRDATSVYGYPGPVCNPIARSDRGFLERFGAAIQELAKDLGLVSMFSRLNPLLGGMEAAGTFGTLVELGKTVSMNLSMEPAIQRNEYRKGHRYEIDKARRMGLRAYRDQDWKCFEDFIRLYTVTMQKVEASCYYLFDRDYFLGLREAFGESLNLFVAEIDGVVCSAALFVRTGDIIQYHLSGTDPRYVRSAPSKLILDEARTWGNSTGAHHLHLGGGVGSREDNLFQFKAGFSPVRHSFFIWKWIAIPKIYAELVAARQAWRTRQELTTASSDFFPFYRA